MHPTTWSSPAACIRPFANAVGARFAAALNRPSAQVLALSGLMAVSSWVALPLGPVPITLQSLTVMLVASLCGRRLAAASLVSYLAEGALGLPVFAQGARGLPHLLGPAGGYLLGFVLGAWVCASLTRRWGHSLGASAASMLAGHAVILGLGSLWLSGFVGLRQALMAGAAPFLLDAVVKVVVGVLLAGGLRQRYGWQEP